MASSIAAEGDATGAVAAACGPASRLTHRGGRGDAVLPTPVRAGRALHRPGFGRRHRRALGPQTPSVSAEVSGGCHRETGKKMAGTVPLANSSAFPLALLQPLRQVFSRRFSETLSP